MLALAFPETIAGPCPPPVRSDATVVTVRPAVPPWQPGQPYWLKMGRILCENETVPVLVGGGLSGLVPRSVQPEISPTNSIATTQLTALILFIEILV